MTTHINPDVERPTINAIVRLALQFGCRPRIIETAVDDLAAVVVSTANRTKASTMRVAFKAAAKQFEDMPSPGPGHPTIFKILVTL